MQVNPRYPLYIVSKGRWESRLTSKALERIGVPYHIVVEEQEREQYAAVIDPAKILILDPAYQDNYDTCDDLGQAHGKGSGAARNFVWDHSIARGFDRHWVMDDNIRRFYRCHGNRKIMVDGTAFRCMEDFVERYENVAMAGPNYEMFVPRKNAHQHPPFTLNTRIYSCNLIRNDLPYRWAGRYNEDTHLSLRMLKDGWCTIQFNAFLQDKMTTLKLKGGNTDTVYTVGTRPKSQMIVDLHPDVARVTFKFNRIHHEVNYRRFKKENILRRKKGVSIPQGVDNYGMVIKQLDLA